MHPEITVLGHGGGHQALVEVWACFTEGPGWPCPGEVGEQESAEDDSSRGPGKSARLGRHLPVVKFLYSTSNARVSTMFCFNDKKGCGFLLRKEHFIL